MNNGRLITIQDLMNDNENPIHLSSNPMIAQEQATKYYNATIYKSYRPWWKYMIFDRNKNKFVHFGHMSIIDMTMENNHYLKCYEFKK